MKTICAALGMAALLTFSASADTLTLPKGHVLDFGDTVDVLDGRQTYFGKQMKNWAEHKNFGKTAETVSHDLKEKTNEKTAEAAARLAEEKIADRLAEKVWKDTKVYQLRANTPSAFYETFVISIPVENKELQQRKSGFKSLMNFKDAEREKTANEETAKSSKEKMERTADVKMGKTVKAEKDIFPKMWKEAKIKNSYKRFLEKKGIRLYTSDVTRWKEKKSSGGKAYRLAKAKIGLSYDGYLFPLFAEGLIVDDGTATTYTLFVGDQKSGSYFAPCIEKAAGRMK